MNISPLHELLAHVRFPDMALVRQVLDAAHIADVRDAIHAEASRLGLADRVRPGQSVAVAVGSRGIDRLDQMVASLCEVLLNLGARPARCGRVPPPPCRRIPDARSRVV